jgi:hypothetical protein
VAGRLKFFATNWEIISNNPWIMETIKGFKIPLLQPPCQHQYRPHISSRLHQEALTAELGKLQGKGVIVQTGEHHQATFLSPIFTIPKKRGEHRLTLNLKALNKFIPKQHFKMEGGHLLGDLLLQGNWMT